MKQLLLHFLTQLPLCWGPLSGQAARLLKDLYENALQPLAQWVGDRFLDFLKWIQENGDIVSAAIIGIGAAVLTWKTIQGVVSVLTSVASALMFLTSPVGIVVIAVGALIAIIALLITHWDDVKEAAGKAWDWIEEKWRNVKEWFSKHVAEPLKQLFSGIWNGIREGAASAWDSVKGAWNGTCDWFKTKVLEPAQKEFSKNWTLIKTAAKVSCEGVQDAWSSINGWFTSKVLEPMQKNFEKNWMLVKAGAKAAWDWIQGIWNGVSSWFSTKVTEPVKQFFAAAWDNIKTDASNAWSGISQFWGNVSSWFGSNIITPIKNNFSGMWDSIKNWASNALDAIKNTWKGLKDWFNDTVIKPIKDLWNNITDSFKGSDAKESGRYRRSVIDEVPRRISYSIPEVPQFASGAVLRKPTLNMAAEYSGASSNPEIVTPESLMREVFVDSLAPLASVLHDEFSRLIESNKNGDIIIKIGDETIAKHAIKGINEMTRRNGKSPLK